MMTDTSIIVDELYNKNMDIDKSILQIVHLFFIYKSHIDNKIRTYIDHTKSYDTSISSHIDSLIQYIHTNDTYVHDDIDVHDDTRVDSSMYDRLNDILSLISYDVEEGTIVSYDDILHNIDIHDILHNIDAYFSSMNYEYNSKMMRSSIQKIADLQYTIKTKDGVIREYEGIRI